MERSFLSPLRVAKPPRAQCRGSSRAMQGVLYLAIQTRIHTPRCFWARYQARPEISLSSD